MTEKERLARDIKETRKQIEEILKRSQEERLAREAEEKARREREKRIDSLCQKQETL